MTPIRFILLTLIIAALSVIAIQYLPGSSQQAGIVLPATVYNQTEGNNNTEKPCTYGNPEWRQAQVVDGVQIDASSVCEPDNPYDIAVAVKGANNVSQATLMQTYLAPDALTLGEDLDGDGDPDVIRIKLEVAELNGQNPDASQLINTYDIAPGIQPGLWVFTPKSRGIALKNLHSMAANSLLRAPSPSIRVEQGDKVYITLENTHYLPHNLFVPDASNNAVEEPAVFPGKSHTYEIQPKLPGTSLYFSQTQSAQQSMMGLKGLFIVEENKPNNWVQTFNIGAGQVRHPAVAVKKAYQQEYDLHYQSIDKKLSNIIQQDNDPRLIAQHIGLDYNITESFENYFLLNGHSFPYTLRDSMIIANDNENIKLHLANAQRSFVAIHFQGHKPMIATQAPQDIELSPGQVRDVSLQTSNNSAGLWRFHDNVPTATTTDGIEPGGNISFIAYKAFVDEQGMPKTHDESLNQLFSKDYYAKKTAIWNTPLLGQPGLLAPDYGRIIIFALLLGLIIGLLVYMVLIFQRKSS